MDLNYILKVTNQMNREYEERQREKVRQKAEEARKLPKLFALTEEQKVQIRNYEEQRIRLRQTQQEKKPEVQEIKQTVTREKSPLARSVQSEVSAGSIQGSEEEEELELEDKALIPVYQAVLPVPEEHRVPPSSRQLQAASIEQNTWWYDNEPIPSLSRRSQTSGRSQSALGRETASPEQTMLAKRSPLKDTSESPDRYLSQGAKRMYLMRNLWRLIPSRKDQCFERRQKDSARKTEQRKKTTEAETPSEERKRKAARVKTVRNCREKATTSKKRTRRQADAKRKREKRAKQTPSQERARAADALRMKNSRAKIKKSCDEKTETLNASTAAPEEEQ